MKRLGGSSYSFVFSANGSLSLLLSRFVKGKCRLSVTPLMGLGMRIGVGVVDARLVFVAGDFLRPKMALKGRVAVAVVVGLDFFTLITSLSQKVTLCFFPLEELAGEP
jgi:hypothetical protein